MLIYLHLLATNEWHKQWGVQPMDCSLGLPGPVPLEILEGINNDVAKV